MESVISCAKEIRNAYDWNYKYAVSRLDELKQQLENADESDRDSIIASISYYERLTEMFGKVDSFLLKIVKDSIK